ncbi:histone deacetylase HDT2-like [Iris pallida]|uniref:Histone deacetylase HDT2-like n=1 Tax=Iris pallida TaxID=29817 RepID=A0AAX6GJP1_IRIPA|nr:histone deacetylase HDT2-like [Iris pallida]
MEFWGVEVKPGQTVKCDIEEGKLLHLSQAALGESNEGVESVSIFVKFNDQKLVVGTLSQEKCALIQYNLVFEKEFDLCHSSKNASVYFCGYKTASQDDSYPFLIPFFFRKILKKEQAKMKAKDENDNDGETEMMRNMFGYKAKANHVDDNKDGVDDEVKAIFDSIVAEEEEAKKDVVSGKKQRTESASKTTAKDEDGAIEMIRNMFRYKPNAIHLDDGKNGVDDEVKALFYSIVAEEEEAKKAAVSGKQLPIESASKTIAKDEDEDDAEAIKMIWNMFMYKPNAIHVDNGEDGVDDEVKAIFDSIVAEEEEAKKAAVSRKQLPIESASKTIAKDDDEDDAEAIKMIRNMFTYKPKAIHVDNGEDGVDDEVKAIFDSIVAEEEEAKKAAVSGSTESASKTPATEKKDEKCFSCWTEGRQPLKEMAHTATPHPAKTGKTHVNNDKPKQQTLKSSGSATCKSCNRSFNSDNALQAHTKAKHSSTK